MNCEGFPTNLLREENITTTNAYKIIDEYKKWVYHKRVINLLVY